LSQRAATGSPNISVEPVLRTAGLTAVQQLICAVQPSRLQGSA
jgi:hypothetical protein